MTHSDHRPSATTPLNPPDVPIEQKLLELEGQRPPEEQTAYVEPSEVDTIAEPTTTAIDEGELPGGDEDEEADEVAWRQLVAQIDEGRVAPGDDELFREVERLDLLTELELRAEETDDPIEAVEEGFAYVPPIDPPITPGRAGSHANAEIANGLALSSLDEPYDAGHHGSFLLDDDEVSARVREALRADSSTSAYADRVQIETRGGIVTLRGVVDDLIDNDNLLAVAAYVRGVTSVIDHLRVRGLG